MKTTSNIKKNITNLKIGQALITTGTLICTYRLGQIASFKYIGFLDNAPSLMINTMIIGNIIADGCLSYYYWELQHKKEKLEHVLKK